MNELNCNKTLTETPDQTIAGLEHKIKILTEENRYALKKVREYEVITHNLLALIGNPWLRIESVDE